MSRVGETFVAITTADCTLTCGHSAKVGDAYLSSAIGAFCTKRCLRAAEGPWVIDHARERRKG